MRYLNIFTAGELVAVTILVLQLILVAAVLRDKRLWRIRQHWKQPRAAIARLEEQSSLDRAQKSAEVSPGSSRRSSMNYRKHVPKFIRSSQDTRALFEEQCRELQAQLAQWQWEQGPFPAVQTEVPAEPGLLRVRKARRRLGAKLPRRDTGKGTGEARCEDTGQRSSSSLPGERDTFSPTGSHRSSRSVGLGCSTIPAAPGRARSAQPTPRRWGLGVRQRGKGAGCGLLQPCSSLGRSLMHLWTRHIQRRHRRRRRVRFATPLVTVRYIE
ncbi:uncharacterized protein LOC114071994 [Empidonax traillii]|uniref:uncharacterized protein LOC114071994 n=1 Tax=Empidonax traillii TaxID=164674 RepID=UPI000FFD9A5F|nr:uncharacterized protein LOC114071994 [Empidonax traillii]